MKQLIIFGLLFLNQMLFGQVVDSTINGSEGIIDFIEPMPEFPGGQAAMLAFLEKTIVYPDDAVLQKIEGFVFLTFIVEPNGSLSEVRVLKGLSKNIDEEAVRVVKSMPNWRFTSQRAMGVRMNLPVLFKL